MSTVRTPARLWISVTVAAAALCLSLLAGVSLIIPTALWIGVVFDWYSTRDYDLPAQPKRVVPQPARTSWIPARDSQVA
jgi:hypothetical protein